MSGLYLEAGIGLCSCALLSAMLFLFGLRSREGRIQVPSDDTDDGDSLNSGAETVDPFDVTKPEDIVDGYPVEEKAFWKKVRLQKIVLLTITGALMVVRTGTLGWVIKERKGEKDLICNVLHAVYPTYFFCLLAFSFRRSGVRWHGHTVIHLSVLSTIAVGILGAVTIIPPRNTLKEPLLIVWYASLALWLLAFWVSLHLKRGPELHFPPEQIYTGSVLSRTTTTAKNNVCGDVNSSPWEYLLFSYTTKVVRLGNLLDYLEIGDLPILSGSMHASAIFASMKAATRRYRLRAARPGSGWQLAYQLLRVNGRTAASMISLVLVVSVLFYGPMLFIRRLVAYLESDIQRADPAWGWVYCAGLLASSVILAMVIEQLWSLAMTNLQVKIRVQLNTLLYAKTLVRKDVLSILATSDEIANGSGKSDKGATENEFSSKAQIMNLMTTDVDRVAEFVWHFYTLIDSPIEIVVGALFLYQLLGVSGFIGLAVTVLFLPLNNYAGKFTVRVQRKLMDTRDKRVGLMNEVLGAIRMLKFMAWERSFEARIMAIREEELKYQHLNYVLELLFISIWNTSPLLVTLVSFWHFTVIRQQALTPSIAFTSIAIFSKLKFALNAIPGTMVRTLQSFVSVQRIEKYLSGAEVEHVDPLDGTQNPVAFKSATVTWPLDKSGASSSVQTTASTPRRIFSLIDLSLEFPTEELSLVCGKLGSGKTLLLLSLLGEADLLAGRIICPRSPPNTIASFVGVTPSLEHWIVKGTSAYVPQTYWLQNATIRENILFNLPYVEERYKKTIEACALIQDLEILEDGDESEVGEQGINLSGGQKARVSLARAIYSRASVLLLDDVLAAVDAHTAHHLYSECLKGELAQGRTIVLVSHHVQLCASGASYVVALDNGRVSFSGTSEAFQKSDIMTGLVRSSKEDDDTTKTASALTSLYMASSADSADKDGKVSERNVPRKFIEEEQRAVGHIRKEVWKAYFSSVGGSVYRTALVLFFALAAASPVVENGWISHWSRLAQKHEDTTKGPVYYISVYALITLAGLVVATFRWYILYRGSINASVEIYKKLLESVLFTNIRFHDTASRGRLLNRFGKDMEVIDSKLPDDFGNTMVYFTSACATLMTIIYVGGLRFFAAALILGVLYYNVAKVYGQCCRELRRLDAVSRSPLYSIYGETISGVPVLRAFGASSKFLRDMISYIDANTNPYFWLWKVNRWVSTRINLLSSVIAGLTGVVALVSPSIDASLAGFTLVFATQVTNDLQHMLQRFVQLEQSMVAVERVKEYSDLPNEGLEFTEPRPPESWPSKGLIECKGLVVRYAPGLPDVLHDLNFKVNPGEKVGILGRTGSGKSTLALSFFRFVEAAEGRIIMDGIDISKIGLTDLRSKLTIIPQDPIILSGTLRSTLDVFDEYLDADIYEALRRVHLIPSGEETTTSGEVNQNAFCNLNSPVSEGGDNFSAGEKQLLCLARAILKRSKVLIMDEATASVDYMTDELIGKTIRHEFADSTVLTIAHRLRTVADYSRVMILDQGRVVEYDRPATLLSDPSTQFYSLCQTEGEEEFATLKRIAGAA